MIWELILQMADVAVLTATRCVDKFLPSSSRRCGFTVGMSQWDKVGETTVTSLWEALSSQAKADWKQLVKYAVKLLLGRKSRGKVFCLFPLY